jgi:glycosyltransferase involved in cell wall biosynthesis
MPNMIFHMPVPFKEKPNSASSIRPLRMLDAFKKLGYEVTVISGYGKERKKEIALIKEQIKLGMKIDFVYSENSTMPTSLTEKNHLPTFPFLDFGFFRFCQKNSIKVGVFYRDIYWRFSEYTQTVGLFKSSISRLFYMYELLAFRMYTDTLYLPSKPMAKYLPGFIRKKTSQLSPGCPEISDVKSEKLAVKETLNLLYVGGLGYNYQLHHLFKAVKNLQGVELTICTHADQWELNKGTYSEFLSPNINVVHANVSELGIYYQKCDLAVLFVNPHEYWEFAVPLKLFEYLAWGKPIIASKGTFAASFVDVNNVGWTLDYSSESLKTFLLRILHQPAEIEEKSKIVKSVALQESWTSRARQVIQDFECLE